MKSLRYAGYLIFKIEHLCSVSYVLKFITAVYKHIDEDVIFFDFRNVAYVKSVATAIFARELKKIVRIRFENGKTSRVFLTNTVISCRYLNHMGFFDFIGVQHKGGIQTVRTRLESPVEGRIPITEYSYLYFQRGLGYDPMDTDTLSYFHAEENAVDVIEDESQKIVQALFRETKGAEALSYCVRESLRNCFEHSKGDVYYVFGQTWNNGKSELVIMDYGVGLLKTLRRKYDSIGDESAAIMKAVEPGVSETDFLGRNVYSNSGFGLYVLCQLAKRFGKLYIASNDKLLVFSDKDVKTFNVHSDGTLVAFQFRMLPDDFGITLEEIIDSGRDVALSGTYPVSPSLLTRTYGRNRNMLR